MKNSALCLTVFASSSVFAQSTAEDIYVQGVIGAASVIGIIFLIGIYKSGKILLNWLRKMLGQSKISKALINAEEEALYAQAASEVAEGDIRPGLWAKATSAVEGRCCINRFQAKLPQTPAVAMPRLPSEDGPVL